MKWILAESVVKSAVGVVLGFAAAQRVDAETFRFRIVDHPPLENQVCDDWAFNEGRRFAERHQVEFRGAVCSIEFGRRNWTIDIEYSAVERLKIVSTTWLVSALAPVFGYPDVNSCTADIENQVQLFNEETGIPAEYFYCRVSDYSQGRADLVIMAAGDSTRLPRTKGLAVYGTILGHSQESFEAMWEEWFQVQGFRLAHISTDPQLAHIAVGFLIYGEGNIDLANETQAKLPSEELCMSDLALLNQALSAESSKPGLAFCTAPHGMITDYELQIAYNGASVLRTWQRNATFPSLDDCQSKRTGLIEHYRTQGRNILFGTCSNEIEGVRFTAVEMLP